MLRFQSIGVCLSGHPGIATSPTKLLHVLEGRAAAAGPGAKPQRGRGWGHVRAVCGSGCLLLAVQTPARAAFAAGPAEGQGSIGRRGAGGLNKYAP